MTVHSTPTFVHSVVACFSLGEQSKKRVSTLVKIDFERPARWFSTASSKPRTVPAGSILAAPRRKQILPLWSSDIVSEGLCKVQRRQCLRRSMYASCEPRLSPLHTHIHTSQACYRSIRPRCTQNKAFIHPFFPTIIRSRTEVRCGFEMPEYRSVIPPCFILSEPRKDQTEQVSSINSN